MGWQDWAVAAIAVVVGVLLVRRVWRFFTCRDESACSSCNKSCSRRR